jgi:hypothetical protein
MICNEHGTPPLFSSRKGTSNYATNEDVLFQLLQQKNTFHSYLTNTLFLTGDF